MQPTNTRLPQVIGDCMVQIFDIRKGRGGIVTIKWVVSIICLLILSVGYASSIIVPEYEELEENLQRWKTHGITNYRMRFQMNNCLCDHAGRSMIVDIRKGYVHSAVYEDDGTPVSAGGVRSIDSLFFIIYNSHYSNVDTHYNAEYGYPEYVSFDSASAIGRHVDYKIELLMIMEEDVNVGEMVPMVSIPAGMFRMGNLSGEGYGWEKPVHSVTVPAFKLGKYEVSIALWDACVVDGGCNGYTPYYDPGWSRYDHPVSGVSWDDVQSFIDWLNEKTGGNYRLPTEAEWEYAARAGSKTKYGWGDDIGSYRANCNGCGSHWADYYLPAQIGSFPANAWGLYDMHGNVSEWVQDCYNESYEGAPTDGSAWTSGDCGIRVFRGGSWNNNPGGLHSADRFRYARSYRDYILGFRLAQDE